MIESLKTQLNFKRVEMHRMREVTKKPTAANTTLPTSTPSATKKAKDAALKRTWFPKWEKARKGKLLGGVFWNLMDGVAQIELMDLGGCNAVFYSHVGMTWLH